MQIPSIAENKTKKVWLVVDFASVEITGEQSIISSFSFSHYSRGPQRREKTGDEIKNTSFYDRVKIPGRLWVEEEGKT